LLYMHESQRHAHGMPTWCFMVVSLLVYLAPVVGLWFSWQNLVSRRHRETTRMTLHKQFNGAIAGAAVILIAAYWLLPTIRF